MEESALIRLARITRVSAYRRRGLDGSSDRVSAYVRKDLDAAGFGDVDTKRGAFAPQISRLQLPIPARAEVRAPGEPQQIKKSRKKKDPIPPEEKARIREKLAAHPVDSKHILAMYDQASEREQRVGREWYPDAHRIVQEIADENGLSVRTVAGLIANYSPQKAFGRNLIEANEVARTGKGIGGPRKAGNNTLSFVPNPDRLTEDESGALATDSARVSANRILAGEDFQDVFAGRRLKNGNLPPNGLKIRAFGELIARGVQDPDADPPLVVVDRHAASVGRGIRLTDDDYNIDGPSDSRVKFEVYATAYRDAAQALSVRQGREVTPEEVQAVTWLARQRLNMDDVKARKKLGEQDVANSLNYFASYLPSVADIIDDPMVGYAALHPDDEVREIAKDAVREAEAGDAVRTVLDDMPPRINRQRVTPTGLTTTDYEGRVGDPTHLTRTQTGTVPTSAIADMLGAAGETPGAHRNKRDAEWEAFKADIKANGVKRAIFITADYGEPAVISEGNHRRDAAVEVGLPEVPVEIRYFGHAEQTSSVGDAPQFDLVGIEKIRQEIMAAGELNSTGGPSCGVTAEEVAALVGGTEFYGAYRESPTSAPEHAWVVMPDGTILDPSGDQFGNDPIQIISPGDPRQALYLDQAGDDDDVDPLRSQAIDPLVNRAGLSASEDALMVLLAKITKVKAHHRRSELGRSENVQSYVRKQLDPYGAGANAKTRAGAYAAKSTPAPVSTHKKGRGGNRVLKAKEVIKSIESRGGTQIRQTGSHRMFEVSYPGGTLKTTVPMHNGDMAPGTMRGVEKDFAPAFGAGWLTG